MTPADRLDLARKLMRASLGLPREHTAHKAIDEAVAALMAAQSQSPNRKTA